MKRTPPKPLTLRVLEKRGFLGELRITSMVFPCSIMKNRTPTKTTAPHVRFQQNELSLFFGSTTTINNNQPSTAVAHREFSHQTPLFPQNPNKNPTPRGLELYQSRGGTVDLTLLKAMAMAVFRKDLEAMTEKSGCQDMF